MTSSWSGCTAVVLILMTSSWAGCTVVALLLMTSFVWSGCSITTDDFVLVWLYHCSITTDDFLLVWLKHYYWWLPSGLAEAFLLMTYFWSGWSISTDNFTSGLAEALLLGKLLKLLGWGYLLETWRLDVNIGDGTFVIWRRSDILILGWSRII